MRHFGRNARARLLAGASAAIILSGACAAHAEEHAAINIPAQPLASALYQFGGQTGLQVMFAPSLAAKKQSPGVSGDTDVRLAMAHLLDGTGLSFRREGDIFVIMDANDPQSAGAAGDGADQGTVAALVVTAQKKEENIQDVPIAISAFTEKTLEAQKLEGGFDLLKAIPNVTFSKNNFTSYNFSIRGIGTKAVSATTDPGVAVSFNNIPLLQNRLFEQEYFDIERVEVLRGPQGTLYGRNATAGVVNVITAKPNLSEFKGWLKGEVGNYDTKRLSAMVNVPLIQDKLAVRIAGALTDRQGFDYNDVTKHAVNGRDLWSGRVTVGFAPTDKLRGNLIWERFNEDDNRSRTGKQLCHHDDGPEFIDGVPVEAFDISNDRPEVRRAVFSQGCQAGSLYNRGAFGTPNGLSYNFVLAEEYLQPLFPIGTLNGESKSLIEIGDPYGGKVQSRNLREIESIRDPIYQANADVVELNLDYDLTASLRLSSQTAYNKDKTYSFQDFNRFNTNPIFTDTRALEPIPSGAFASGSYADLAPGGIFCDPQLGCSDRLAGFDIAKANGEQFSHEIRLQSSYDGPLNFSLGANYTRFRTLVDYYVMFNLMTAMAESPPFHIASAWGAPGPFDLSTCYGSQFFGFLSPVFFRQPLVPVPVSDPKSICPYVDPNSLEGMDGEGHNYFRSKNPYKVKSAGVFGELYWEPLSGLKVTAGLRYSDDRKTFIPVPSQVLLARGVIGGGVVSKGYPENPPIKQHWGEWTGRLGVDWKPDVAFTDQSLIYAFYSRGYKAGGANPPTPGFATLDQQLTQVEPEIFSSFLGPYMVSVALPTLSLKGNEYPQTFKAEFVNAFEVGTKNTALGGAATVNADVFFYDYRDYQVSQIRDRTAVNENFNAKAWGAELETVFSPTRDMQFIANFGYLDTQIADGERSIDIMNRTQSNPNYVVVKPWVQLPSNCVAPAALVKYWLQNTADVSSWWQMCGDTFRGVLGLNFGSLQDPTLGGAYDPANYPEINGGAGLLADLGGKELPNAPHWTISLGGQYGFDFLNSWRATVRADAYWQSQSWARVYNDNPYDKLHGWYNVNFNFWVENQEGLKIEVYAKNVLNKTPITDAFLNSDDTGLTTNVFVLDPRLIGMSIKKEF